MLLIGWHSIDFYSHPQIEFISIEPTFLKVAKTAQINFCFLPASPISNSSRNGKPVLCLVRPQQAPFLAQRIAICLYWHFFSTAGSPYL